MVIRKEAREMKKILISACLVGRRVRYDGESSMCESHILSRWASEGRLVLICPEVAGGLSVPRPAAEIIDGGGEDVLDGRARLETKTGRDVTAEFLRGAQRALEVAEHQGVKMAILKARSPSCGSLQIYDGTFSGQKRAGQGVTSALLERHGIAVFNEEELEEAARYFEGLLEG